MDPVEYTIRVSAALDAALRRRARETEVSLDQVVIEALSAGLETASPDGRSVLPGRAPADGAPSTGLEQEALDEGTWL